MKTAVRVDETTMNAVLNRAGTSAAGVILRLAWQAGLTREEIRTLTWSQVDLMEWKILLPGRTVPLSVEMATFLLPLGEGCSPGAPVVGSRRSGAPLTAQTISHMARSALTAGGGGDLCLTDLREDFALRLLADGQNWQAVSRVTGMKAAALRQLGEVSTRASRAAPPTVKTAALEELLKQEGASPAGTAISLAWREGLGLEEIASLRWEQLSGGTVSLGEGPVRPLSEETQALLKELRPADGGGFVLATRTGRPYDLSRLSRLVRSALVRCGLDDVTARDLRHLRGTEEVETLILGLAAGEEGVSLREVQEALALSDTAGRRSLRRLTEQGKLTRVGLRYYLPSVVVPPAEQEAAILGYLAREGFAYRQDIAKLLHIPAGQCRPILKRLVAAGKVRQENQRYTL